MIHDEFKLTMRLGDQAKAVSMLTDKFDMEEFKTFFENTVWSNIGDKAVIDYLLLKTNAPQELKKILEMRKQIKTPDKPKIIT